MSKTLPWKRYVVQEKEGEITGLFPSSKSFPTIPAQTIASRCRSKNKTADEEGFVYWWLEDYPEEKFKAWAESNLPTLPTYPPQNSLKLILTISGKLVSVNSLYGARVIYVHGRPTAMMYKTREGAQNEKEILRQLSSVDLEPWREWLEKTKKYSVSANYIIRRGINSRDLSNLEKVVGDSIVKHIHGAMGIKHFDDSEFFEYHMYKSIIPGADHEYACYQFEEFTGDPRYDHIPAPERVYIGGKPWESGREKIIEELEAKNLEWYCPELNPWKPDEWGWEETRGCNTYLQFFDLSSLEVEQFVEVRDKVRDFLASGRTDKFLWLGFIGTSPLPWIETEVERLAGETTKNLKIWRTPIDNPYQILNIEIVTIN